jgi:type III secretory pathway component EscS
MHNVSFTYVLLLLLFIWVCGCIGITLYASLRNKPIHWAVHLTTVLAVMFLLAKWIGQDLKLWK